MATILIGGDHATTTSLAIAAGWPIPGVVEHDRQVVLVEADPSGGSVAAWLDTPLSPSLSAVVTALHQGSAGGATPSTQRSTIDAMIRRTASGVRCIPAPFRAREARGAVAEAEMSLFPILTGLDEVVALVDVGRIDPLRLPGATSGAALCIVTHRQDSSSAPAATVRLERLAETIASLCDNGQQVGLALIGTEPFSLDEVVDFTAPTGPAWPLAVDPLAAAVLAGRTGVSARRLARLPLMRSAARIGTGLAAITAGRDPHTDPVAVDPAGARGEFS